MGFLVAKVAWIIAHALVLVWWLRLDSQKRFEEQILVFFVLSIMSFPSGYLLSILIGSLDWVLGNWITLTLPGGWPTGLFVVGTFFIAGYLQWFKLGRYVISKAQEYDRERRDSRAPDAEKETQSLR